MDVGDIDFEHQGEQLARQYSSTTLGQTGSRQSFVGQKIGDNAKAHLGNSYSTSNTIFLPGSDLNIKALTNTANLGGRLILASLEGQWQMAKQILNTGVDVNHLGYLGITALHYAAVQGHDKVARLLITHGADVNALSPDFGNPLCLAALNSHTSTVQLLLDNGASLLINEECGLGSPLHCACYCGNVEIMKKLFTKGNAKHMEKAQYVNETAFELVEKLGTIHRGMPDDGSGDAAAEDSDSDNESEEDSHAGAATLKAASSLWPLRYTPLMLASERGYLDAVKELVSRGAKVGTLTRNDGVQSNRVTRGGSALFAAAAGGQREVIRYLIGKGAKIDQVGEEGSTPLLGAAMSGCPAAVQELIDNDAATTSQTSDGYTALMLAAACIERRARDDVPVEQDFTAVVRLLLAKKVDAKATSAQKQTALMFLGASDQGSGDNLEITNLLLDAGVDIDAQDVNGFTALMYASINAPVVADLLIHRGADVTKCSPKGITAFHLAILGDYEGLILSMAQKGAKLDAIVNFGSKTGKAPPLALAAAVNSPDCVKLLLELSDNLDIEFENSHGLTSLSFACRRGNTQVVDMLLEAGAKPRMNQLYLAVLRNDVPLAKKLFKHDLKLNDSERFDGGTVLQHASALGYKAFTKLLIDEGAEANAISDSGRTALSYVVERDRKKMADILLDAGADTGIRDTSKPCWDPIAWAVSLGSLKMVEKLHSRGASLSRFYDLDGSLFNIAVGKRHLNVTSYLVQQGVDMYVCNVRGLIAFQIAMAYENEDGGVMADFLYTRHGADAHKVRNIRPYDEVEASESGASTQVVEYKPPLPPRRLAPPPAPVEVQYQEQVTVAQIEYRPPTPSRPPPSPMQYEETLSVRRVMAAAVTTAVKASVKSYIAKRAARHPAWQ